MSAPLRCPECHVRGGHNRGCPWAPDAAEWDELTDAEKRAQLLELDREELAQMVLSAQADVAMWERKYLRCLQDCKEWHR